MNHHSNHDKNQCLVWQGTLDSVCAEDCWSWIPPRFRPVWRVAPFPSWPPPAFSAGCWWCTPPPLRLWLAGEGGDCAGNPTGGLQTRLTVLQRTNLISSSVSFNLTSVAFLLACSVLNCNSNSAITASSLCDVIGKKENGNCREGGCGLTGIAFGL